ncbi:MAG: hypothetical protein KBC64_00765 [Simkaniaceae bacterium]|nr:hypothetical protein [Simkaniaceae bacterium]
MKRSLFVLGIFGAAVGYNALQINGYHKFHPGVSDLHELPVSMVDSHDLQVDAGDNVYSRQLACSHSSIPEGQTNPDLIDLFFSHLQVGASYTRVKMMPHGNSVFNGDLGGLQGLYEFRTADRIYGGLKLAWRQGPMTGSEGKRTMIDGDIQERIGYTFGCSSHRSKLSLYTGFGFRYLRENYMPKTGDSVKFKYQEFYVPVGFLYDYQFSRMFDLGLNFTWMPQVYPTVTIVPLKGCRWIITDTIANFLVEVPFTFTSKSRRVSLIFKPFFQYWQDGHTTAETATGLILGLPGNTYLFGGIEANLCYSF